MNKLVLPNILRFVILILLQILVLNYVYLGGYMIPFIYLLAILMLPTRIGKIPLLLIAFGSGMLIDVFCNIPGFHAFSCTMMALARIIFGHSMLERDDPDGIEVPNMVTVPFPILAVYFLLMSLVYCLTYFLMESFCFGNFLWMMLSVVLSTLATWALMLLYQLLVPKKHEKV